jgi:hypothetical protein
MGHDVAGREVTDFVTFVARHARTRTSARREAANYRDQPGMKGAAS